MIRVYLAVCATAAALYIASFAWSAKVGHDRAIQGERTAAQRIIQEEVDKATRGQ